jgi:hypothetical protein
MEHKARIDDNRILESTLYCRHRGQRNLGYPRKRFIEHASGNRQYSLLHEIQKRKKKRRPISDLSQAEWSYIF